MLMAEGDGALSLSVTESVGKSRGKHRRFFFFFPRQLPTRATEKRGGSVRPAD